MAELTKNVHAQMAAENEDIQTKLKEHPTSANIVKIQSPGEEPKPKK